MSFPTAAQYLQTLPDGIASYTQCRLKAANLHDDILRYPLAKHRADIPQEVCALVESPPAAATWLPEVVVNCYNLTVRDQYLQSEDAWRDWARARMLRITKNPAFRVLFAFVSPRFLINNAARRWSLFRQGSTLDVVELQKNACAISLRFPPHLYEQYLLLAWQASFEALIQVAGGKKPRGRFEAGDTHTLFELQWK